ncbi:hypothetical protein GCM10009678_82720 [Actinomadura kijaniata]
MLLLQVIIYPSYYDVHFARLGPASRSEAAVTLLQSQLTRLPVTWVQDQHGGFTPDLAARVRSAGGQRVFVKGINTTQVPALAAKYRLEAQATAALPPTAPAPRLLWSQQVAGWLLLMLQDLPGRYPDFAPGSPDLPWVVAALQRAAAMLTPNPWPAAPPAIQELGDLVHGWRALADHPSADLDAWARRHLPALADGERAWLAAADGPTLLHGDLRADNMLLTEGDQTPGRAVWLIDWAQPYQGSPWIDLVDLIPHLILAGHTAAAAEHVVAEPLAQLGVQEEVITSYAIAFAGYWARMSWPPTPSGAPHLRAHQARACQAACQWVAHRTSGC